MIPIYKSEIDLGLGELIQSNASVAYTSVVKPSQHIEQIKNLAVAKKIIEKQPDLYYLDSVLVSVGWNKNDDVFTPEQVWNARNTPVDKKFNYMHDEKDIIGHMTAAVVVNEDGLIDNGVGVDEIPNEFDIVVASVLYKIWEDQELQERMDTIIDEIEDDKWFVSMECLFTDFDYALDDGDQIKIVARNSNTAFLTKHLRSYGGSGIWEDQKLGRVLKNCLFSGKGLVDQPANPGSIVFNKKNKFNHTIANISEKNMTDSELQNRIKELEKENKDLASKVQAEAKAKFETEKQDLVDQLAVANDQVAEANKSLEDSKSELASKDESISNLEKSLDEANAKVKDLEGQIDGLNQEKIQAGRLTKLVEAGLKSDEASKIVETWKSVSDEQFEDVLELHKAKVEKTEAAPAEETEEVNEVEAEIEVEVEETATAADAGNANDEDDGEALQKAAASWLNNVLKMENE